MTSYYLAKGVTLEVNQNGGLISVKYPQRKIKLSERGVEALQQLCGEGIKTGTRDEKLTSFAAHLENQGVLVRRFSPLEEDLLPTVSIVIPTFNRGKMLASCIESLLALNYPKEKLEIIIVDDASPVPVELNSYGPLVKVIRQYYNQGPGAARNRALREAAGEIIAFTDDDCLVDRNWLRSLVPCFKHPDVAAVGGRVESAVLITQLEKYEQVQSPLLMGEVQRKVRRGSALSYLATCNLLVRKKSLLMVGGFNPQLRVGEDVDLCWRILAKGELIYYVPDGLVLHYHRSRLVPFVKRRYHYGQSEAKLQKIYRNEKRKLILFPGNGMIMIAALLILLLAGFLPALWGAIGLAAVNLFWQSGCKWRGFKSLNQVTCPQILSAMVRSQGAAVYLYAQHFSRYYSIPAATISIFLIPILLPLFLVLALLPGIVDYKMKRPGVKLGNFIFYNLLENLFYQAGVYSGCLNESCFRPLAINLVRADAELSQ